MLIRPASISDLPSLNNIYNIAVYEGFTGHTIPVTDAERLAWFQTHLDSGYPVLIAEDNGIIKGWLSFSAYRPGRQAFKRTAEISYYIHADYRKKGIGSVLIEHAMKQAASYGYVNLLAIILENNIASIHLLENRGFNKWGVLTEVADYNGNRLSHVYYGINLI